MNSLDILIETGKVKIYSKEKTPQGHRILYGFQKIIDTKTNETYFQRYSKVFGGSWIKQNEYLTFDETKRLINNIFV